MTTDEQPAANYAPRTIEQIEALVEEVIEANSIWPDSLSSQRDAVMDVVREAMAQAWDEGYEKAISATAPREHGVWCGTCFGNGWYGSRSELGHFHCRCGRPCAACAPADEPSVRWGHNPFAQDCPHCTSQRSAKED